MKTKTQSVRFRSAGEVLRNKTYTAGANAERSAILAHVRRLIKNSGDGVVKCVLSSLSQWLGQRNERYQKRRGGLGK